jgi:glycine oxidase
VTHPDVLVLGGGIIGLTAARELALRKLRVEVVERQPEGEDGAEASLAAGGMLSPVNPDTLPGPFADVALASRDLWPGLVAALESDTGIDLDFDRSGALLVAVEDGDLDFVTQMAAAARGVGETVEEVDFAELHRLVPDLAPDVRRALLLHGEYRVDNVRVIAALRRELAGHGVVVHPSSEAQRIEIRQPEGTVLVSGHHWRKESGFVVVAAGAWSGRIEGLPPLPIRPVRGQMLRLEGARWPFGGSVRCGDSYGVRRGPAGLVVGSTAEEAGFAKHNTVDGIEALLAKVRRLFPGLGGAHLDRIWAGLRPAAPDGLPVIGWLPGLPVLVATGHFRNGILLAPWTAQHLVDLAVSGDRRREVPAFSPSRFFAGR